MLFAANAWDNIRYGREDASDDEVRAGLEGNLCRCTGYQNIVKSILAAAEKMGG